VNHIWLFSKIFRAAFGKVHSALLRNVLAFCEFVRLLACCVWRRICCWHTCMRWLRLVGSLKSYVSLAEYCHFCRALLQKRPLLLRSLLIVATQYVYICMYIHAWPVKIQVYCGGYKHRTGLQQRYVGLLLKNPCLNGHRCLLEFPEKVMSTEKFWKQEIITNTPFKFVNVLQVKDRIERTCDLQFFHVSIRSVLWCLDSISPFMSRHSKEGVLISILFNFKHNPRKSGGVPCVPFWNVVCCCFRHTKLSESSRNRSKLWPTVETTSFREQSNVR